MRCNPWDLPARRKCVEGELVPNQKRTHSVISDMKRGIRSQDSGETSRESPPASSTNEYDQLLHHTRMEISIWIVKVRGGDKEQFSSSQNVRL